MFRKYLIDQKMLKKSFRNTIKINKKKLYKYSQKTKIIKIIIIHTFHIKYLFCVNITCSFRFGHLKKQYYKKRKYE